MNKRIAFTLLFVFLSVFLSIRCADATEKRMQPKMNEALDYQVWAKILNTYVDEQGRVDYEGLGKNREAFDRFLAQIEQMDISDFTPEEEKAFWINAYNAITLKVVLDNYPVKSIRRINFGLVWQMKREVAGTKYSLGHIEHKILRPMGDPRIHFAINCASIGCPKLSTKPFYSKSLEEQLDFEARRFINDSEKVRLDRDKGILYHSAIFDWFEEDFLVAEEDLLGYIRKYLNAEDRQFLENDSVELKTLKYDWNLNKQ